MTSAPATERRGRRRRRPQRRLRRALRRLRRHHDRRQRQARRQSDRSGPRQASPSPRPQRHRAPLPLRSRRNPQEPLRRRAPVSAGRRREPGRRGGPGRRCGNSLAIASQSASTVAAPVRTAASSGQSSGLRRSSRSVSRSRSSGVRARRTIRCISSPNSRRSRAASRAPSPRPSTDSSSMMTGSTGGPAGLWGFGPRRSNRTSRLGPDDAGLVEQRRPSRRRGPDACARAPPGLRPRAAADRLSDWRGIGIDRARASSRDRHAARRRFPAAPVAGVAEETGSLLAESFRRLPILRPAGRAPSSQSRRLGRGPPRRGLYAPQVLRRPCRRGRCSSGGRIMKAAHEIEPVGQRPVRPDFGDLHVVRLAQPGAPRRRP